MLARSVDLGALAAFARETDFDLGAFLMDEAENAEDGGAARLVDFADALSSAADSLRRYSPGGGGGGGGGGHGGGLDDLGRAVQVDPMKPNLKPPGTKRLKLNCGILLSTYAFKFNLRRYT